MISAVYHACKGSIPTIAVAKVSENDGTQHHVRAADGLHRQRFAEQEKRHRARRRSSLSLDQSRDVGDVMLAMSDTAKAGTNLGVLGNDALVGLEVIAKALPCFDMEAAEEALR